RELIVRVNGVGNSGYPDCLPAYAAAFERLANLAAMVGIEGGRLRVHAPVIDLSKAAIVTAGTQLGVRYAMTVSCYQADADGCACGVCDSCRLRREGFSAAALADPTRYQSD